MINFESISISSDVTIANGSVLVYLPGNVTGSGKVDSADTTRLRFYIAGHPVPIVYEAADVTGDGKVDSADTTRLRLYNAGHPVILGPRPQDGPQATTRAASKFSGEETSIKVSASHETAAVGETVTVVVSLDENIGVGINTIDLRLGYDPEVLQRVNVSSGGIMNMAPITTANPFIFVFETADPLDNYTGTGTLATVTFLVLSDTPATISLGLESTYRMVNYVSESLASYVDITEGSVSKPVLPPKIVKVTPTASVRVISGNQNELTITVTEFYSDGSTKVIRTTLMIKNNAEGTYQVGSYKVFINTKGNDQIREIRIV